MTPDCFSTPEDTGLPLGGPAKRQIAVAIVKSSTGMNFRIELLTVADLVHLFALSMGYMPNIAFALGVISRSSPEVQAGELDCSIELASKSVRLAELISVCRQNQAMPDDRADVEAVLAAVAHVHTVEQAYTELCATVEGIEQSLNDQYNDWFKKQESKEAARTELPSFLRWFKNLFTK